VTLPETPPQPAERRRSRAPPYACLQGDLPLVGRRYRALATRADGLKHPSPSLKLRHVCHLSREKQNQKDTKKG
jgi:hypothetical protein